MPVNACVWVRGSTSQGVAFGVVVAYITTGGKVCNPLPGTLPEVFIPSRFARDMEAGIVYACEVEGNPGMRQKFQASAVLAEIGPVAQFNLKIGKQVVPQPTP
ncbi:MAG: hypothetical protein BWY43_00107 [candidate division WS2 bacterium ADurb.Bin280]|uniref:Uncharacterized protein n=1 Tax=candidate division WS2 bacterium ADurb.Bin280 TaxID=1852829 RepID=A0A1V5SF58_9BACT|nr:MAG: hypothetical protein BWY43_00107 [candidate division WS2 bacterium ADurb.Bin280]